VVIVPAFFSITGATTVISSSFCVVFSIKLFFTSALTLKAVVNKVPHRKDCPITPR
jgi:hypothetical protein